MVELTIIIVNWNTRDDLSLCLMSIREHCDPQRIRTIVVDNASNDGSRDMVVSKFPEVTLINTGANIGFGRANNVGLRSTDTPYVMFLNPDTLVIEDSITKMLEFIKSKTDVTALQCKQIDPDGNAQTLCIQWEFNPITFLLGMTIINDLVASRFSSIIPYHDPEKSGFVKTIAGGCFMVRKNMLDTIGGFDERFFMYAEDGDLCRRIRKAGGKIYYKPDYSIIHGLGHSSKKAGSLFSEYMKHESYEKFLGKYYGISGKVLYRISVFFCGFLKWCILSIVSLITKQKTQISKYTAMMAWSLFIRRAKIVD